MNSVKLSTKRPIVVFTILLFFAVVPGTSVGKSDKGDYASVLILPIQANLKVLEERLNTEVPEILAHINELNKVCVEAQWAKTKVPYITWEMKKLPFGIKTKLPTTRTKMAKTRISHEIRCDIKGWVKRNGHISVSGSGSTLKFSFPIKAHASAKPVIPATANATATIYVSATPRINNDWSISVDVAPEFSWSQRPTLKLFGLIQIKVGNKVEPKLREKMNEFVKTIPAILADLKLKEKIAATWSDIQNPIKVADTPEVYVLFNPKGVAYSGFNIENNILKTTLSVSGNTQVTLGKPIASHQKTGLSNLGTIPYQDGEFSFSLPVLVTYNEILAIVNDKFPDGYVTDLENDSVKGILKISNPEIQKSTDGKLFISVSINYDNRSNWLKIIDIFDWFDIDGALTFRGVPIINSTARTLKIDKLEYYASTGSELFDALVDVAGIKVVRDHIARQIVFKYGSKLDNGVIKANKALNITTKGGVKVSAYLQKAAIDKLSINDSHLKIDTKLFGVVSASIGL